jgi:serine/threonine protein kinase
VTSMVSLSGDGRRALAERLAAETGGVPAGVVDAVAAMVDDRQLVYDENGGWRLAVPAGAGRPGSRADFIARALHGRYVTGRVLFKGGVLTTYAAVDARGGRTVELHVPARRVATSAEADHFLRTLERVAALSHPGILPVIDYGATAGVLYFTTPPVEVESLREQITGERPLALDESVRVATEVARALAYAHARGVYHHDLRPKHVFSTLGGSVLARLGVAEALTVGAIAEGGRGPDNTGVLIGAPAYLSPEQLADEGAADARSDIYSLGCVLHEMLTGEPPFGGRGRGLIARKLTEPPPSVRAVRDEVPEPLDQLVRKCLARAPADRYQTVDEMADALEGVHAAL